MICCSTSIVWGMYRYGAGDSLVKLENYVGCPWNLCGASVKCSVESFSHKTFIGGWLWAPQLRVAVTSDHCRSSKHRHSCLTHKTAESLQTICERVKNACSTIVDMQDFTKAPKSTVHGIHTYFISTELTTCTVHLLETGTFWGTCTCILLVNSSSSV